MPRECKLAFKLADLLQHGKGGVLRPARCGRGVCYRSARVGGSLRKVKHACEREDGVGTGTAEVKKQARLSVTGVVR